METLSHSLMIALPLNMLMETQTEPPEHLQRLDDFVRAGALWFDEAALSYGHGTDNAWDEAAQLVLWALGLSVAKQDHDLRYRLTDDEKRVVWSLLRRRVQERKPAAYLIHEAWFAGLRFYVDERVLIPRSPLAELIAARLTPWVDPEGIRSVLDLCTGSGCIGIACAHVFPQAHIDLADISGDALEVAEVNITHHGLEGRVQTIQSDLFDRLPGRKYDVIICNPPYVDAQAMAVLPDEYRYEPELGLAAGSEGLDLAVRILYRARTHLHAQGVLIMELGDSAFTLAEKYPKVPFLWLEFEQGGHGVLLLTAGQCREYFE